MSMYNQIYWKLKVLKIVISTITDFRYKKLEFQLIEWWEKKSKREREERLDGTVIHEVHIALTKKDKNELPQIIEDIKS